MKYISSKDKSLKEYILNTWQLRHIIYTLAVKELKNKYSNSLLGLIWAILIPLFAITVVQLFFGMLLKVNTGESPYILFATAGMTGWYYFLYIVSYSGISLIQARDIIKKVYFPRIIFPLSKVVAGVIEFSIWLLILVVLKLYFKPPFSMKLFVISWFLLINILCGLSIGIWLCILTMKKRDLLLIVPYLIGFGIFVTPVFYPPSMIPENIKYFMYLNPMAYVIEGYRWALGLNEFPSFNYSFGIFLMIIVLVLGLWLFAKKEKTLSDCL